MGANGAMKGSRKKLLLAGCAVGAPALAGLLAPLILATRSNQAESAKPYRRERLAVAGMIQEWMLGSPYHRVFPDGLGLMPGGGQHVFMPDRNAEDVLHGGRMFTPPGDPDTRPVALVRFDFGRPHLVDQAIAAAKLKEEEKQRRRVRRLHLEHGWVFVIAGDEPWLSEMATMLEPRLAPGHALELADAP